MNFIVSLLISVLVISIDAVPAFAGKTVWENGESSLDIFGDLRFRAENDSDDQKDKDRTRERVRARFGSTYKANEMVSAGFRLSTGSDSLQSPHQTLDLYNGYDTNGDFGLDRAFIKVKLDGLAITAGKTGFVGYDPAELVMDGDIQPEGISAKYNGSAGDINVWLGFAHYLLNEASWGEDDTALFYQAGMKAGEGLKFTGAISGITFTDSDENNPDKAGIPGKSYSVMHLMGEITATDVEYKPTLGIGYANANIDESVIGAGSDSADKNGLVIYLKGTFGKIGLRAYYWDLGYASASALGSLAPDNFPFSSNFTGYHLQMDYKLFDAIGMDLRYYNQTTKNEEITVFNSDVAMQGPRNRSRVQLNLNVKF